MDSVRFTHEHEWDGVEIIVEPLEQTKLIWVELVDKFCGQTERLNTTIDAGTARRLAEALTAMADQADARMGFRAARGCAPAPPGSEPPEVLIRRMRDDVDLEHDHGG